MPAITLGDKSPALWIFAMIPIRVCNLAGAKDASDLRGRELIEQTAPHGGGMSRTHGSVKASHIDAMLSKC
jgi:hypothetical protein